jgi:hypothetical protein
MFAKALMIIGRLCFCFSLHGMLFWIEMLFWLQRLDQSKLASRRDHQVSLARPTLL